MVMKQWGAMEIFPIQNYRPFRRIISRNLMERYRV